MNERIKELAEQAENYAYSAVVGGSECQEAFIKKFAKLIVQECASICYNSNLQDSDLHAQNLLYEFNIDNARNLK